MPFYGQYTGFGAGGDAPILPLIDIITNLGLTTGLKLCLDAGDANSYTSGQQWLDTSGGGYDFDFGASASASSDDPTFNGVAGGLSSAEYMSFDGGDHFEYETTIATWMNNIHKNNAKFSWFAVQYFTSGGGALFATTSANNQPGIFFLGDDDLPKVHFYIQKAGSPNPLSIGGGSTVSRDQWNMIAGSVDEAGGDVSHLWLNGAVDQVSSSDTFDAAYASPSTSSADNLRIGKRGDGQYVPDGTRLAAFAMWEGSGLPTGANFSSIRTELLGRGF